MPLRRLTSFIWYYSTRNGDADGVAKFKNRLWIPPKGAVIPASSPWSAASEKSAFATFTKEATGEGAATKR